MKYNGVDYNEQWVLRLTLDDFINHIANKGKKGSELNEVYNLVHGIRRMVPNRKPAFPKDRSAKYG